MRMRAEMNMTTHDIIAAENNSLTTQRNVVAGVAIAATAIALIPSWSDKIQEIFGFTPAAVATTTTDTTPVV